MNFDKIIKIIQEELSEDLLKSTYQKIENKHKTTGHCYIASEAIFHLCGGKEKYMAFCGRDFSGGTHWWLLDKENKKIIDPTAEQYFFLNEKPPYDKGKPCGFLTKEPSKRCQKLIDKITKNKEYKNTFI